MLFGVKIIRLLIPTRKIKAQDAAMRRTNVSFVLFVWSLQAEIPPLLKLVIIPCTDRGALNRMVEEIVRSFKEIFPSKILQGFNISCCHCGRILWPLVFRRIE